MEIHTETKDRNGVMKHLALSTLATLALGGAAMAADMTEPVYAPAPTTYAQFDWTGVYAGIHAGYAWGQSEASPIDDGLPAQDADGFLLGGQLGYNMQYGDWVFGAEADLSWTGIENDVTATSCNNPPNPACEYVEIDWMSTIRGRVGYAMDRTLFYGTGGLALAGVSAIDYDAGPQSASNTHVGYAVGAGIEHAFTDMMSVKAEYLYVDLGSKTYNLGTPDSVDIDAHTVKVGLNYHF